MSQVGRVTGALELPKGQAWSEEFRFWGDRAMTVPVAIASAEAELRRTGGKASAPAAPVVLTGVAGQLQITDNIVTLRLSEADLSAVEAGVYELVLGATDAAGAARQVRAFARVFA